MADQDKKKTGEVVCEFFGIEITTNNPKIARLLTTDLLESFKGDQDLAEEPDTDGELS